MRAHHTGVGPSLGKSGASKMHIKPCYAFLFFFAHYNLIFLYSIPDGLGVVEHPHRFGYVSIAAVRERVECYCHNERGGVLGSAAWLGRSQVCP